MINGRDCTVSKFNAATGLFTLQPIDADEVAQPLQVPLLSLSPSIFWRRRGIRRGGLASSAVLLRPRLIYLSSG